MAGTTEEVGSTARTLISSLASTPMVLALVVFNVFYIGFSTYLQAKQGQRFTENQAIWEKLTEKALESCVEKK
jgi:hypothetical protein